MIRRFVFALCALTAAALGAELPLQAPQIEGGTLQGSPETGLSVRGHVHFTDPGGLALTCDELTYYPRTETITAVGHIVATRFDQRLLANRLVFHRRTQTFVAENVRLGRYPYFAEAFSAEGSPTEITLRRARISYGEPGPWQPTWTADSVTYTASGAIRSENSQIGLGSVQPVPFPRFRQNLAEPLAASLAVSGGYRRSLGLFATGSAQVPVNATLQAGADLGLFTNRGVMFGPSGRYEDPGDPDQLRGFFRSGYINDHGDKKTDLLGRPVPENRAFVEWQHQQTLADNLTLSAQLNWWKDSEVVRDFRPRDFFPVQEPDNFVESVYTGANYFVTAFTRFQPNRFHRVQERLPEVRFDLLPVAIGGGALERFNASAAVLREDPLPGESFPYYRSDRLDAYYAIERPWTPTEWFTLTPVIGGRVTHYANIETSALVSAPPASPPVAVRTSPGDYTRTLGEVGFDAVLRASGTFAYQNPQWKIDGLRHLLTPRLSYRYIPEADKGAGTIPPIDRDVFSTYLPPLGLGDVRNIDELHATNTLRLALDNVLQTRDGKNGSSDLVAFSVAADYRFHRERGVERALSLLHHELTVTPADWLKLEAYASYDPRTFRLREFNSGITLRDGMAWSVRFANNFLRPIPEDFAGAAPRVVSGPLDPRLNTYFVDARVRLTEAFEARAILDYDQREHRFNQQAYGITQNLGNTWLISYTVSLYSGRRRESGFGFNVQIDTVRF